MKFPIRQMSLVLVLGTLVFNLPGQSAFAYQFPSEESVAKIRNLDEVSEDMIAIKIAIKLMALLLIFGLLILNSGEQFALVEQLFSEEQTLKLQDVDEGSESHAVDMGSKSDRETILNKYCFMPIVLDKVSVLNDMANVSKSIYSSVRVGNWTEASAYLQTLQQIIQSLPASSKFTKRDISRLNSEIISLESLITAHQRLAMDSANRLVMVIFQLAIQAHSGLPIEISMLDYYGRELEIWAIRGNTIELRVIANKIAEIWYGLRPSLQAKGHSVAVQNFEETLMTLLDATNSPTEYSLLSAPLLAEVNHLQQELLRA